MHRVVFGWLKLLDGGVRIANGGGGAGVSHVRQSIDYEVDATPKGGGEGVN